jgi:hypothetical protein
LHLAHVGPALKEVRGAGVPQHVRDKLDVLCRRLFGKKSERADPAQLRLALDLLESEPQVDAESLESDSGEDLRPRERRGRADARGAGRSCHGSCRATW